MDNDNTFEIGPSNLEAARRYSMTIVWSPEDEIYVVSVPEIPGLHTHGATHAEAAEMGEEAIATWLEGQRRLGRPIPPPPLSARRAVVEKPSRYSPEQIRSIRARLGLSQSLFAAALNVSASTVRAWEQGNRAPDGASLRLLEIAEQRPESLGRVVSAA